MNTLSERIKESEVYYAPLDVMVPSSYRLTKTTSTKSRGAIMPIAAEGVTVLQTDTSCVTVGTMQAHNNPNH